MKLTALISSSHNYVEKQISTDTAFIILVFLVSCIYDLGALKAQKDPNSVLFFFSKTLEYKTPTQRTSSCLSWHL